MRKYYKFNIKIKWNLLIFFPFLMEKMEYIIIIIKIILIINRINFMIFQKWKRWKRQIYSKKMKNIFDSDIGK
jgi:hypothetical protein